MFEKCTGSVWSPIGTFLTAIQWQVRAAHKWGAGQEVARSWKSHPCSSSSSFFFLCGVLFFPLSAAADLHFCQLDVADDVSVCNASAQRRLFHFYFFFKLSNFWGGEGGGYLNILFYVHLIFYYLVWIFFRCKWPFDLL